MGKRGPKPKFTDVTCPNEDCEDYGKVNNGNIIGNGTYIDKKMVKYINFIAKHVKKALLQTQTLFYMYLRTDEKDCVHML